MSNLLNSLSNAESRFFPKISAKLYDELTKSENKASQSSEVLSLVSLPFKTLGLWTGKQLNTKEQLGRIFKLHKLALQDELDAHWKRADFYWREIEQSLKTIRNESWSTLENQFNVVDLHKKIINELLIDSLWALINGHLNRSEKITQSHRVYALYDHVDLFLKSIYVGEDERWQAAESFADNLITRFSEQQSHQDISFICNKISLNFPERWKYQDTEIHNLTQNTFVELDDRESDHANSVNATILEKSISKLEKILKKFPNNPHVYQSLAILNQVYAVNLANSGQLSDALFKIEHAIAYEADPTDFIEIRKQILAAIKELKAHAAEVKTKLSTDSNLGMTEEGLEMMEEARKGRSPANRFIHSGEAERISDKVLEARAFRLWHSAGLGRELYKSSDLAMKLYTATQELLIEPPVTEHDLAEKLRETTSEITQQHEGMHDLLMHYFTQLFFVDELENKPTEEEGNHTFSILEPNNCEEEDVEPPLGMWFFSASARLTRIATFSAMLVMLTSLVMFAWDSYSGKVRDQAYEEILLAKTKQQYPDIIKASMDFLAWPGIGKDSRSEGVRELLRSSQVYISYPELSDDYSRIVSYVNSGDTEQVALLSEQFLSNTESVPKDPRRLQIEQFRLDALTAEEQSKRSAAYDRLIDAETGQNIDKAIVAADDFLSVPQKFSQDYRTSQVELIRNKLIDLPNLQIRNAAYTRMLEAEANENTNLVLTAAETFLDVKPGKFDDSRQEQVVETYRKAFRTWFIALSNVEEPLVAQRIKYFQSLGLNSSTGGE